MPVPTNLAELERIDEDAYASMYKAKPHAVKDCHDEARSQFRFAIEEVRLARELGAAGYTICIPSNKAKNSAFKLI